MIPFEPERYELLAGPAYRFAQDRRSFFKTLGGGIVVVSLCARSQAPESGSDGTMGRGRAPQEIGAWLHIGADGLSWTVSRSPLSF